MSWLLYFDAPVSFVLFFRLNIYLSICSRSLYTDTLLSPYRYVNVFECHLTRQKYLENKKWNVNNSTFIWNETITFTPPAFYILLSYLLKHTSSFNVAIKSTFSCFYNVFWNLSQFVVCTAVEKTQQRIYEYVVLKLKQMSLLISTEPLWAILNFKMCKNRKIIKIVVFPAIRHI